MPWDHEWYLDPGELLIPAVDPEDHRKDENSTEEEYYQDKGIIGVKQRRILHINLYGRN